MEQSDWVRVINLDLCWIGKSPMDVTWMCESQKPSRVSVHTKRLYSSCMDSMARHETNTCDIWKMVSMVPWSSIPRTHYHKIILDSNFSFAAYLSRNFNVVLVDWKKLTYYPCYFSALGNTKLVAQCTAQVNHLAHTSPTSHRFLQSTHSPLAGEEWNTKQD